MRPLPILLLALLSPLTASADPAKPVLLYSRAWNAEGESRYQPTGSYSLILEKLRTTFDVRISADPLTTDSLKAINVILIANPSDKAVPGHPAPRHLLADDRALLTAFVNQGGGLILMGNQENHNLETTESNQLLAQWGLKWEPHYTDVKAITLPAETPIIGGLKWAYYTGNSLTLTSDNPAKPQPLIPNDTTAAPLNGPRNAPGVLLATATPGHGRIVAITDAGWISNSVLQGKGIGGTIVPADNNIEILQRLALWAATPKP